MEISDIIKYVSETPGNTNPAVLASMINQLGGGGSGSSEPITVTFKLTGAGEEQYVFIQHLMVDDGGPTSGYVGLSKDHPEQSITLYAILSDPEYGVYNYFGCVSRSENISSVLNEDNFFSPQYGSFYDEENAKYLDFGWFSLEDGGVYEFQINS